MAKLTDIKDIVDRKIILAFEMGAFLSTFYALSLKWFEDDDFEYIGFNFIIMLIKYFRSGELIGQSIAMTLAYVGILIGAVAGLAFCVLKLVQIIKDDMRDTDFYDLWINRSLLFFAPFSLIAIGLPYTTELWGYRIFLIVTFLVAIFHIPGMSRDADEQSTRVIDENRKADSMYENYINKKSFTFQKTFMLIFFFENVERRQHDIL